jgi:hypothetical protein
MGSFPKIFFGLGVPNTKDKSLKYDLSINRRTKFLEPIVESYTDLPGFKIVADNGINQLTGEASD